MGLFSFLRRDRKAVTDKTPRGRRVGDLPSADIVRTQARRRLVGAAVLVVVAVLVLPWVFDSKPRPLPVDIPIDLPKRDLSMALPEPPPARAPMASTPASEVRPRSLEASPTGSMSGNAERQSSVAQASAPSTGSAERGGAIEVPPVEANKAVKATGIVKAAEPRQTQVATPSKATEPVKAAKAADANKSARSVEAPKTVKAAEPVKAAAPRTDAARAQAALEGREASVGGGTASKFVVQVGAFEQAEGARDARQRVAKVGLQAHETVVQTADGKRIRVRLGPYASREEAEKAAAKLRAGGVSGAVVPQ